MMEEVIDSMLFITILLGMVMLIICIGSMSLMLLEDMGILKRLKRRRQDGRFKNTWLEI